jgi:hypothetical protein
MIYPYEKKYSKETLGPLKKNMLKWPSKKTETDSPLSQNILKGERMN